MRRFQGRELVIATHNPGKLTEFREMFAGCDIDLTSLQDRGLPVPAETATRFVGNARIKAQAAARASNLPALADDSGLTVDALGGAPGVLTADWAEGPGGRDFVRAMTRLHDALRQSGTPPPWTAAFRCALVLAWPDGTDLAFEGRIDGQIVWPMRGATGHGYDPVFQPAGCPLTFAQMDTTQKNRISHRAVAFRGLRAACFD